MNMNNNNIKFAICSLNDIVENNDITEGYNILEDGKTFMSSTNLVESKR